MSFEAQTPAEQSRAGIDHPYEREAIRLLHAAGWSSGELVMCFQVGEGAIARIVNEEEAA